MLISYVVMAWYALARLWTHARHIPIAERMHGENDKKIA